MNILPINRNVSLDRGIEGMGKGLVLLKARNAQSDCSYYFHIFLRNGRKPPFDVAISPYSNNIEYISFFIQDETIKAASRMPDICLMPESVLLSSPCFSIDRTGIDLSQEFDTLLCGGNLVVLATGVSEPVTGYRLSEKDYVLIGGSSRVAGLLFAGISEREMATLIESEVISR